MDHTVEDPVTHTHISLHDNDSDELQSVPQEQPPQNDAGMSRVVDVESHKFEASDNVRETKIRAAYIAALATLSASSAILIFSYFLGAAWAVPFLLFAPLVAATCVLHFWNPRVPQIQLKGEDTQLHKQSESPETALWLNAFLHALWPIVNPSLFISIADMLEDALKASLPKLIQGVRVADIGQGSEAIRILGMRSLDSGRTSEDEGDFVNLEVAMAYRAKETGRKLKDRSGNPHMLMEFSISGGVIIPVWLMPNPPFLSAMTLTLLGHPKVTLNCTPLAKSFLNVMDVPGLSGWIQEAIDAAVGAYIAPQSLSLDLKTMLSGQEQMDTLSIGVIFIVVKSAKGFRNGDAGKFWESNEEKRGDPYVTIGWGKRGKPIWSSRIIENEGNPHWGEVATLLVGSSELNAKERLRLQIWDSDRGAADDLLGTVELNLHDILNDSATQNKISARTDRLTDIDGKPCPGELEWECGYFGKTTLEQHLQEKGESIDKFIGEVEHQVKRELRETETLSNAQEEFQEHKKAALKDRANQFIADLPPRDQWPSGLLYIYIEQIRGLEVQQTRKASASDETEDEEGDDLPSAYCTLLLNHQAVYKTRTKLKSNKPFFGASTERFIKDWRTTSLILAVRDSRLHEADALIGVVNLPLRTLFKERSHVSESFPLTGGIGYGRVQISLVFRSVQAQLPRSLLSWDVGTLDIQPHAREGEALPSDLKSCRLVLRTLSSKAKLYANPDGGWTQKRNRQVRLTVQRKFGECMVVEFRRHALGPDSTPAFCTLWLQDVADDDEKTLVLPVWPKTGKALDRARVNAREPEGLQRLGTLELTVRLCPGLSGYHKALRDSKLPDIMQVLQAAEDDEESTTPTSPTDEESDDSSSSESEQDGKKASLLSEAKDYIDHKDELHQKHRGLMQWGPARKIAYLGHNVEEAVENAEHKVTSKFKHRQAEPGIDVEA
ncbi:hypothetical protein FB45DRAFT_925258 [Roridomyces roridus]|uniref:Meiotically up-regulated gene 190 protein n=1 Tax=Roridomyces roridus TaxID=1738132 RepID=A0AAD7BJQ2_9AGAR|nr:hypothetical protein FB45DRAFT_925258 [Roridomyces roridus]